MFEVVGESAAEDRTHFHIPYGILQARSVTNALTFSKTSTAVCEGTVDRLVLPLAVVVFRIVRHLVSLL